MELDYSELMRELPPVSEDFTRKQLLARLGFYNLKPKYLAKQTKTQLITYIQRYETLNTRQIEDENHE